MKLLALSDIHDNLAAVRALRATEKNVFDAVAVAGDIGNKIAPEFFEILATFDCPIVHVYGNWDDELPYEQAFADRSTLIHMNVVTAGDIAFAGFSGCSADWGRNPIARRLRADLEHAHRHALAAYAEAAAQVRATQHHKKEHDKALAARNRAARSVEYQRYRDALRHVKDEILQLNRRELIDTVRRSGADPGRLVLLAHERQYRLHDELPGIPLHLFGHQHGFSEKASAGTKYVNVSILDHVVTMRPRGKPDADTRDVQAGNYAVVEIRASGEIEARCVHLPHDGLVPVATRQTTPASAED